MKRFLVIALVTAIIVFTMGGAALIYVGTDEPQAQIIPEIVE